MLQTLKRHIARDEEEGFTLIELMVVVLIIAILLAIAIPTFLGARERANDRAAQSSLRNALTAAKTLYTDSQDYSVATDGALDDVEPSLSYLPAGTASTSFKSVSVDGGTSPSSTWSAAAKSKSGKCFAIKDVASTTGGGTFYGKPATCSGAAASAVTGSEW